MKVLVINAGSSSLKYQLIDMATENALAKGVCERIGLEGSFIEHKGNGQVKNEKPMPTHVEAIKYVLEALTDPQYGVIKGMNEISAVGHRVVHSAEDFTSSMLINEQVMKVIENNIDLAPLHQPANITGIRACKEVMPNTPMVAVFDTTFHSTMPDYAYMYGLTYDDYKNYRVRRYGFHGTSHLFVSSEAQKIMGKKDFNLVVCHLGNGASITAVKNCKSVDTSMGMTPLEGLIMGTRCGDLDPAIHEYLMGKTGMNINQFTNYCNKKCGVMGISGISSDFRDLLSAMNNGNDRARLAVEMFAYRVLKYVGSYAAVMNGLDMIAFTGGVGEHTTIVRKRIMDNLGYLGLQYDAAINENPGRGKIAELSTNASRVKAYIIPTNEELVIARETVRLSK